MKKLLSLILCAMLLMTIASAALAEATYELAMITDTGNIDDQSFNQYSYEGLKIFAEKNQKTYAYYKPSEDSNDARMETIKAAVDKGAKTILTPGFLFAETIKEAQTLYPDVNFLFLDYDMGDEALANVHCVVYKEEQAGFLAGYAAVKDGYKKLGFIGGIAVPAVVRYGYGYVQGAEYAAKELGVNDVTIKYWYSNSFVANDEITTKMQGWVTEGTEVIFCAGGGIVFSALKAAQEGNTKIIGVDVDQVNIDKDGRVITSAIKGLTESVVLSLEALYANNGVWPEELAGKTSVLGAKENSVGLPTADASWKFNTFTKEEYTALFGKVAKDEIEISNAIGDDERPVVSAVTVDYME